MTPGQVQGEIDAYDSAIDYVDDAVAQLVAGLGERGLDNTLIAITSDHGEASGEHDLFQHTNSLYREVLHVPPIFWWPGHVPEGVRISETVSNATLPVTILDLFDQTDGAFPGLAFAQLWRDPGLGAMWSYPPAQVAQIPWLPAQYLPAHGAMWAVLSPRWHYIVHDVFGEELYAWRPDPEELTNLAGNPGFQSVVDQFRVYLDDRLAGTDAP